VTTFQGYQARKGLFIRVGEQLGLDPSYISRVASAHRQHREIILAIEDELKNAHRRPRPKPKKPAWKAGEKAAGKRPKNTI
jgi:hypothetical protein